LNFEANEQLAVQQAQLTRLEIEIYLNHINRDLAEPHPLVIATSAYNATRMCQEILPPLERKKPTVLQGHSLQDTDEATGTKIQLIEKLAKQHEAEFITLIMDPAKIFKVLEGLVYRKMGAGGSVHGAIDRENRPVKGGQAVVMEFSPFRMGRLHDLVR
jgi:hypothetical protein